MRKGMGDVTGITETAVGSATETEKPTAPTVQGSVVPALLTTDDIELELRRLVRRLVVGTRLLHRSQPDRGAAIDPKVLLDLKIDGVRCLLTRQSTASRQTEVRLTPREREVARMVALGFTNATIASKLAVSPWTVSTHLRRIFAKLDVTTRAAMVAVIASTETEGLAVVAGARLPVET
jgi:DNA-binding CsgD family transcriptional regulator